MNFRIADTFTDTPLKLIGEKQKVVESTAIDLQPDRAKPGPSPGMCCREAGDSQAVFRWGLGSKHQQYKFDRASKLYGNQYCEKS
jgi:hypothetical protein